jgi:hypothetical protein
VAEDADEAAPAAVAVAVSAAVAAAVTRASNGGRASRPSWPNESSAARKAAIKTFAAFFRHELPRGKACPEQSRRMSPSAPPSNARKTPPRAYPDAHGQKRNRIPEAHRQVPDLDHWIHDCVVRSDRPLRLENLLGAITRGQAGGSSAGQSVPGARSRFRALHSDSIL